MPRYIIERDIPGIGLADREALREAAEKSNGVLAAMKMEKKNIQWDHSYVAGDKTFCVYLAESEDAIKKHSELSGIPFAKVTEVPQIIDPLTANN